MRYTIFVVTLSLFLLTGCSNLSENHYVIDTIQNQFDVEISSEDLIKLTISNKEFVIFQSPEKEYIFVFSGEKLLEIHEISDDDLSIDKFFYAYSEDSKEGLYYVVGGISIEETPSILLNKKPLETNTIPLEDSYIFISVFDKPLDKPAEFELDLNKTQ